jgi:2,4-dienoyl-CoA reductase-like NADH-dependent reductase (Old Yellow Enzyme family)/thioredoxin reductase
MEIRNRIVRTAHGTYLAKPRITEDFIAFHVERAKGGCAMSILQAATVHDSSVVEYSVADDSVIPALTRLSDSVHAHGMKVLQQLWYGGNIYRGMGEATPYAVSSAPGYRGVVGKVATKADIAMLAEAFADGALRCRRAGLDGVEIHGAHGYIFSQFLSPAYNNRIDNYGGSIENRARFLLETLRAVRSALGRDFVVGLRVAASQAPNFLSGEDVAKVVRMIEAERLIDYLNVSYGDYYRKDTMNAGVNMPMGYALPGAEPILKVSKLPRIVAGRFRTLDEAETILREGTAEMVSMVRAHIADPYLVNKSLSGHPELVRSCIACNQGCGTNARRVGRIGCTINPTAGWELTMRDQDVPVAPIPLKLLVVGGGLAGLEAARTAALAGHNVVLAEATAKLGGQVLASSRAPTLQTFGDILQWLEQEVYRLGVEVRLNSYMTAEEVRAEDADKLIIATGSEARLDGFQLASPGKTVPGCNLPHVTSSFDLMTGPQRDRGSNALVLDTVGTYHAVCVAEFLLSQGKAVTYVTHLSTLAPDGDYRTERAFERFAGKPFTLLTRHVVAEVKRNHCLVNGLYSEEPARVNAEIVILVTPNEPRRELWEELGGDANLDLILIGDALSPRDMQYAISDGHRSARSLSQASNLTDSADRQPVGTGSV